MEERAVVDRMPALLLQGHTTLVQQLDGVGSLHVVVSLSCIAAEHGHLHSQVIRLPLPRLNASRRPGRPFV